MDDENVMIEYKGRKAIVGINYLVVNTGIFQMLSAKELFVQEDKKLRAYEDSVKEAYTNRIKDEAEEGVRKGTLALPVVMLKDQVIAKTKDQRLGFSIRSFFFEKGYCVCILFDR